MGPKRPLASPRWRQRFEFDIVHRQDETGWFVKALWGVPAQDVFSRDERSGSGNATVRFGWCRKDNPCVVIVWWEVVEVQVGLFFAAVQEQNTEAATDVALPCWVCRRDSRWGKSWACRRLGRWGFGRLRRRAEGWNLRWRHRRGKCRRQARCLGRCVAWECRR